MREKWLQRTRQFHRIKQTCKVLPTICLVAFLCAGCGFRESEGIAGAPEQPAGKLVLMETTPVVDYAVPQLTPNVLVDLKGYQKGRSQQAAVKGEKIPEMFRLVDADTGQTVFTGYLDETEYSEELGLYSAYADFDEWSQTGNYYLECDYIGRSYTFSIREDQYQYLLDQICQEKIRRCEEQTITLPEIIQMLLAYEWYGEIFPDADKNGIPEIMEEIAIWISSTKDQPVPEGEEASYAAALAKFSFLYQKFDRKFATECLKRASVVFEQNQYTLRKDAEKFHALTELYRASGLETYQKQIVEYKTYFSGHKSFSEDKGYLYGAMTYIATRQKVDVELCRIFTDAIMEEGEQIGDLYKGFTHPVNAHNNGADDLLHHALELACANYVMENYSYNQIMEEFLHYLSGRNYRSVVFYTDQAAGAPDGDYLVLLAQLVAVGGNR